MLTKSRRRLRDIVTSASPELRRRISDAVMIDIISDNKINREDALRVACVETALKTRSEAELEISLNILFEIDVAIDNNILSPARCLTSRMREIIGDLATTESAVVEEGQSLIPAAAVVVALGRESEYEKQKAKDFLRKFGSWISYDAFSILVETQRIRNRNIWPRLEKEVFNETCHLSSGNPVHFFPDSPPELRMRLSDYALIESICMREPYRGKVFHKAVVYTALTGRDGQESQRILGFFGNRKRLNQDMFAIARLLPPGIREIIGKLAMIPHLVSYGGRFLIPAAAIVDMVHGGEHEKQTSELLRVCGKTQALEACSRLFDVGLLHKERDPDIWVRLEADVFETQKTKPTQPVKCLGKPRLPDDLDASGLRALRLHGMRITELQMYRLICIECFRLASAKPMINEGYGPIQQLMHNMTNKLKGDRELHMLFEHCWDNMVRAGAINVLKGGDTASINPHTQEITDQEIREAVDWALSERRRVCGTGEWKAFDAAAHSEQ
jgi:hypothetical protein